jgi:hypothetical protein
MRSESYLINHKQCPQCKQIGKDNGRNNLGIYSDGHAYCFSCGYTTNSNKITQYTAPPNNPTKDVLALPGDVESFLPTEPTTFLSRYGFTKDTCTKNTILWSESRQMLVFPYFIKGELLGWQGRLFGPEALRRKWFTQGKVDDFLYIIGKPSRTIILVESIISAIMLSRIGYSSPIFGSTISNQRLLRLSYICDRIIIWLDPDKQKVAVQAANRARMFGLDVHVILSDMKPKDYSLDEIEKYTYEN